MGALSQKTDMHGMFLNVQRFQAAVVEDQLRTDPLLQYFMNVFSHNRAHCRRTIEAPLRRAVETAYPAEKWILNPRCGQLLSPMPFYAPDFPGGRS